MPNFRVTLLQNLPNREPSALSIIYTYSDGRPETRWFVEPLSPARDVAVVTVASAHNLLDVSNVLTRRLETHYPTAPNSVITSISSIQSAGLQLRDLVAGNVRQEDVDSISAHESHQLYPVPSSNLRSANVRTTEETSMSTNYNVNISMNQATVVALAQGNFQLYGFKAVQTTQGGGAPLVWFSTNAFSLNTAVNWIEQYQAYTSKSAIIPNGSIIATAPYDIDLDQTLQVNDPVGGTGDVVNGGTNGAISILNQTTTQFTCGISQVVGGVASPLCAFPLYGNNLDVIAPIEKVLLMFSTTPLNTGTVIYQAYSQGILIDLTGTNSRAVNYDINAGWTWGGGAWAQAVPANSNLVPLLIGSSSSLEQSILTAQTGGAASRRSRHSLALG
jgi:hypothetical protein